MMDFVDLARRAAATSTPGSMAELEVVVRSGLRALAEDTEACDEAREVHVA
jgi:hypothetical protein